MKVKSVGHPLSRCRSPEIRSSQAGYPGSDQGAGKGRQEIGVKSKVGGHLGGVGKFTLTVKQFILLCVHLFNKYLLSVCYVSGSMLEAGT